MDSMDAKKLDRKLKDMKVVNEMRDEINVLRECLKTCDLVIDKQCKAIKTLTKVFDISVQKIPEFEPMINCVKDTEESIQQSKDNLQTLKASLVETNLQKVDELIRGWKQCAATSDQCVQTEEECDESVDMIAKSAPISDTIGVQSLDAEYEPTVKTVSSGDCVDRESEMVESDDSCVTIDSEIEVTAKILISISKSSGGNGDDSGRQTPGSERKGLDTNETQSDGSMATTSDHQIEWRRVVSTGGNANTIPMYACQWSDCEFQTRYSHNIKRHINVVHKKVKPYVCQSSGCQYRTNYSSYLKRHQRRHQKDPNYRLQSFPIHIESSDRESEVTANSAGVGTSGNDSRCNAEEGGGRSERKCLTTNGTPIKRSMATTSAHRSERPLYRREVVSVYRKILPKKGDACETSNRRVNRHNVRPFACDRCEYRTGRSWDLNRHKLCHQKDPNYRLHSFPIHIESSDRESEVTANSAGVGTSGNDSRCNTQEGGGGSERKCLATNGTPSKRSMATTSAHRSERPLYPREVVSVSRKPSPKKRYACERTDCGYKTSERYQMTLHMNRHNNVRPFGCDRCAYRAGRSSDLNRHKRRYENNPNYRHIPQYFHRLAKD